MQPLSRRSAMAVLGGAFVAGCSPPSAELPEPPRKVPRMPEEPLSLVVLDVAGNLLVSRAMIENFQRRNPKLVRRIQYLKAPSSDVTGKIKAQQNAGRVSINVVLTGSDGLSALRQENMLIPLLPRYEPALPNLRDRLVPGAWTMQQSGGGYGVVNTYGPNGPLLEFAPERVPVPPTTPRALLDWAGSHPGRFCYARPENSGAGRTLLMGLPYVLGDRDPKDPDRGWDNTWAYLKEMDRHIAYYPSSTGESFDQFADGALDIIASTDGMDVAQRSDGVIPLSSKVAAFEGFHWVADSHFVAIPRGVKPETIPVVLKLIDWMLRPDQQALAYDEGFISFPARGVTTKLAGPKGREIARRFGRPDFYPRLMTERPVETPLRFDALARAFDRWNREIGSRRPGK